MAAISSFLNQATIEFFPGIKRGVNIYSGLVANPSTGKSAASARISQAINRIEEYNNIDPASSRLTNGCSIESILRLLETTPSLTGIILILMYV